ncbi:MAG: hypothetical protein ACK5QX_08070 [bacterium]|jgi:hypothetical protein
MSNRVTLAQLREMTVEDARSIPLDQLATLLEDVATARIETAAASALLQEVIDQRFSSEADFRRRQDGKDIGAVSFAIDDFMIRADLPKKIEWDQAKLAQAVEVIKGWNENPAEYVNITFTVPEARFAAWPETIRKVFEPARTVGVGRPTYKIEPAKRRAA